MLNALLGETRVLPTNGMRACTAALIEMRHEETAAAAPLYSGEVEEHLHLGWFYLDFIQRPFLNCLRV